jgi:hypothetical protein
MEMIHLTDEQKRTILDFLDYSVDEKGVIISKKDNKPYMCPYTGDPVLFNKVSIMPGSTVIFNTSPLTLAQYFSEHVENGEEV